MVLIDELYKFLLGIYVFIVLIHLFFDYKVFSIIEVFLFFFTFYRLLSKDKGKRKKENDLYLTTKRKILRPFDSIIRSYRDRKYYVYRKCHNCKYILRLPLPHTIGIKHIKCPKCKKRMTTLILRKEKVEVIFKKGRVKR